MSDHQKVVESVVIEARSKARAKAIVLLTNAWAEIESLVTNARTQVPSLITEALVEAHS